MRSACPRSRWVISAARSSPNASLLNSRSMSRVCPWPCSSTAIPRRPSANRSRTSANMSTTPNPPWTTTSGVPPSPWLRQYISTPFTGAYPSVLCCSTVLMPVRRAGEEELIAAVWWDGAGTGLRTSPYRGGTVQYAESVVDLVGNTPLVRLGSVTRELGPDAPLVLAKLEYLN